MLNKVQCKQLTRAYSAEKVLLETLEGGCSVPISVKTSWRGGKGLAVGTQPAKD